MVVLNKLEEERNYSLLMEYAPCSNETAHCSAGTKGRSSEVSENQSMAHKGHQGAKCTRGKI